MNRASFALAVLVAWLPDAAFAAVDFQRDIRPILSGYCFKCHGPDDNARKGKLRLDSRDAALKGGRNGPAFVPGKPDESALIQRLISEDQTEVMPPPSTGKKLTAKQIASLKEWIASGGKYQGHWAFTPPRRPPLPVVKKAAWARNPIDLFVLERLDRAGLQPSPRASQETLLRRASLDLIGLSPTPEQADAYLADTRPGAYERIVEQLLGSPQLGERWGRHWLDAARYADSDGYEKDKPRWVWMYRDWVTRAVNSDLPYDRFVVEQIAGDLLPGAGQDQRVATGFLRNSMINEEGGIDPEQFRMEAMFDRMDALGKAVLGLTLSCAQCHNHKYDPISQEEYYRLFAFLNDTYEASVAAYTLPEQRKRAELFRQIRQMENNLRRERPNWRKEMISWAEKIRREETPWLMVKVENQGDNAQRYVYNPDGSMTAGGYAPTKWTSEFRGKTDLKKITGFRLDLLTDPELPLGGPGRSPTGLFALSEFLVEVADAEKPQAKKRVKLVSATADFGNERRPLEPMYDDRTSDRRVTGPISYAIDGDNKTAWGIDAGPGRRNTDRHAVFVPEKPIEFPAGAILTFRLVQMHGGWNSDDNQNNNLGRFRFSVTGHDGPKADRVPRRVRAILAQPQDAWTAAQEQAVFASWRTTVSEWKETNDKIEALWKQHPAGTPQLTMTQRGTQFRRETFVLERGDFLKPTRRVEPGVPAVLGKLPDETGTGRLALARWLADRNHPTTARAIVNRVWQAYFGTGLVATSEDLGVQSATPTHPELLDWLAVEFMESGWSLKHLHRLIVTSATYQQSSRVTPEQLQQDPENRLLSRGPRFRVEGEVVRDLALSAAGLLNETIGGAPVYPPAPEFLFRPPASYGPKVWREESGVDRYRRAFYTFRFRSVPYPVLTNFDTPNGDASCVRRVRSNTPLQALTTLNEPLFLESARALGLRALCSSGSEEDKLRYAFRLATGRRPQLREVALLKSFLERQTQRFGEPDAKPWDLAANDPAQPPKLPDGVSPAQAAAWTATARLLLNLDETITKE